MTEETPQVPAVPSPDILPPVTWKFRFKKNKLTSRKLNTFLLALAQTGNFVRSAKAIQIHPTSIYDLMRREPTWAAAVDLAKNQAVAELEEECRRRAVTGVDEPQFYKGEEVATIKRYSDRLLEFLLMAHGGEKYAKLGKGAMGRPGEGGGISITIKQFSDGKTIAKVENNKIIDLTAEDAVFVEEQTFEQDDSSTVRVATPPVPAPGVETPGAGG